MNSVTAQALCPEKKSNCSFKLCCQKQHLEVEERWLVHCKMWFTWKKKTTTHTAFSHHFHDFAIRDHWQWMLPVREHRYCLLDAGQNKHSTQNWIPNHTSGAHLQLCHCRFIMKDHSTKTYSKSETINSSLEKFLCSFQITNHHTLINCDRFSEDHNFLSSFILKPSGTKNVKNLDFPTQWHQQQLIIFLVHTFLSECEWYYKLEGCEESNLVCFG